MESGQNEWFNSGDTLRDALIGTLERFALIRDGIISASLYYDSDTGELGGVIDAINVDAAERELREKYSTDYPDLFPEII